MFVEFLLVLSVHVDRGDASGSGVVFVWLVSGLLHPTRDLRVGIRVGDDGCRDGSGIVYGHHDHVLCIWKEEDATGTIQQR